MLRNLLICSASALVLGLMSAPSAQALTMKECSTKFQAAKQANTLKGQKWNDFRKQECSDEDASDADAAAAHPVEAPKPAAAGPAVTRLPGAAPTAAAPAAAPAATTAAAPVRPTPIGRVTFPKAVSAAHANETPGRARLKTCADQYNANKANNGNGNLRWIETGGGYWSECNKRLKA
jgi:hypothetical protein